MCAPRPAVPAALSSHRADATTRRHRRRAPPAQQWRVHGDVVTQLRAVSWSAAATRTGLLSQVCGRRMAVDTVHAFTVERLDTCYLCLVENQDVAVGELERHEEILAIHQIENSLLAASEQIAGVCPPGFQAKTFRLREDPTSSPIILGLSAK